MTEEWKQKIDAWRENNRIAGENQRALLEAEKRARESEKKAREEEELRIKIEELGKKFKCHVCGTPSKNPGVGLYQEDRDSDMHEGGGLREVTDWSKPGDLYFCEKCEQLTCCDCIHDRICKTCAEKL